MTPKLRSSFRTGIALLPLFSFGCATLQTTPTQLENEADRTPEEWYSDNSEQSRTWQAARVRLPSDQAEPLNATTRHLVNYNPPTDNPLPVVIYLHGCAGFWEGSRFRMDWYAKAGFAVIAPDSFARRYYPTSCNTVTLQSGLYRPTIFMRQYDVAHAIEQARKLPWVDGNNIFLVGLSEGAAVVATFDNKNEPTLKVRGRIIESWGCRTSWIEYQGINAPTDEPVLAMVADRDPWYNNQWQSGNCGEYMNLSNGSVSHVVDTGPLQFGHRLLEDEAVQEVVKDFLQVTKQ